MLNVAGYMGGSGGGEGNFAYEVMTPADTYEIKESEFYGGSIAYMCAEPQYKNVEVDIYCANGYTFDETTGIFTLDSATLSTITLGTENYTNITPPVSSTGYSYMIFGASSGREMIKGTSNSSYKPTISRYGKYGVPRVYDSNNCVYRYYSVKKNPTESEMFITTSEKEHEYWGEKDGKYYAYPYSKRADFINPIYLSGLLMPSRNESTNYYYNEDENKLYSVHRESYYWFGYEYTTTDDWKTCTYTQTIGATKFLNVVCKGCMFKIDGVVYLLNSNLKLYKMWGADWEAIDTPITTSSNICVEIDNVVHILSRNQGDAYYYTFDGTTWTLKKTFSNLFEYGTNTSVSNTYAYDNKIYFGCDYEEKLYEFNLETKEIKTYYIPFMIPHAPIIVKDNKAFVLSNTTTSDYLPNCRSVLTIDLNNGDSYWTSYQFTEVYGFNNVPYVILKEGRAMLMGYRSNSGSYSTTTYSVNITRSER